MYAGSFAFHAVGVIGSRKNEPRVPADGFGSYFPIIIAFGCGIVVLALMLALLTPALAQSQGSKKNTVAILSKGKSDGAIVRLQVTIDGATTMDSDLEFAELLVANPAIVDVVVVLNKQV